MTRIAQCKAAVSTDRDDTGLKDGQFRAIVSVFDEVDSYGDVVVKGAFAETLNEWADRGDEIPVIWSHDWADPFSHLGTVKSATETERGLEILGEIPQEDRDANPRAAQVYRLLKERRITQFSFAFDVLDGAEVEKDGKSFYELRRLKLHEVGPCLLGVNQATELIDAKAAVVDKRKAATLDRAKHAVAKAETLDDLRAARDLLDSAIGDLTDDETPEDDDESDSKAADDESADDQDNGDEGAEPESKGARARPRDILRQIDFESLEVAII